jgi:O-antigen/teichoic acid export membrane protein
MSMKRNVVWSLAGMGLPLLLGAAAIPYLFKHLGVEAIGILTLIWALIGYFSLFDFGLGRALTQQISASLASGAKDQVPGLTKSGLFFTAGTGLAGGLLLGLLAYPMGFSWLNVSPELQLVAAQSLLIAAIGIPLTTVTTGLRGVLEAYEDFRTANLLRMLLGLANFGFPVLCVMLFGPKLTWIIFSLIVARFALFLAHLYFVDIKLPAGWRQVQPGRAQLRRLFSFGAWMTVTNIVGPLMVTADRFIISAVLGANVVAYYTVPAEMLSRLLILPAAVTAVLFPRLASVVVQDIKTANRLYRKCLKVVALVMIPACALVAAGSHWGLSLWLGHDFAEQSWLIVSVMALGILFNSVAFVPFAAIQAAGHAHVTAKIHLVELVIYVPLLVYSLYGFGLLGAALVGVLRVGADLIAMMISARTFGFGLGATSRTEMNQRPS